jgi:hypothetical protein
MMTAAAAQQQQQTGSNMHPAAECEQLPRLQPPPRDVHVCGNGSSLLPAHSNDDGSSSSSLAATGTLQLTLSSCGGCNYRQEVLMFLKTAAALRS